MDDASIFGMILLGAFLGAAVFPARVRVTVKTEWAPGYLIGHRAEDCVLMKDITPARRAIEESNRR